MSLGPSPTLTFCVWLSFWLTQRAELRPRGQEPWPQSALGSPFTLCHVPEAVAWTVLQAWLWRYVTTLAHRMKGSPGPTTLTLGHVFSPSSWLFSMRLLGKRELGVGAWEGRTPGFPQAGG